MRAFSEILTLCPPAVEILRVQEGMAESAKG